MNSITLFLLTAVAIGFLGPVLTILSMVEKGSQAREKGNERARLLEHKEAEATRRQQLHDARMAKENNAVVLQDMRLELEQLKILKLKKEMGLTAPDFNPEDYSS